MLSLLLLLQVIQALTASSTADLLAVGLNLATAARLDTAGGGKIPRNTEWLLSDIRCAAPAAELQEAAAAEALLRLFIKLCRRPHLARLLLGAAAAPLHNHMFILNMKFMWTAQFCSMPGALKLPAGTAVELVELVLQTPMADSAAVFVTYLIADQLQHQRHGLPSRRLAAAHVKRLLALLQGPTAAAATAAFQRQITVFGMPPLIRWLARQPGAVAAAAELGLTAADVSDPAAAALLFAGQRDEGDA
jgi:hypothetical protein